MHAVNNDIKFISTSVEANVSQRLLQIESVNADLESVATTTENNMSLLFIQLDETNDELKSLALNLIYKVMYPCVTH